MPGKPRIEWRRQAGRAGRLLWNDKVAAAHTVFYLVSAAIFLPLVAGMFLFMQDSADAPPDPARGLDSRARAVLHQITDNPGLTAQGSTYWESYGLNLQIAEVGIRDEDTSMLSYAKIDNLQRGGLVSNPNDPWLNYPEFRTALRLDENTNFHLRMSPVILNPSNDPYGTKPLAGMHVAYVADLASYSVDAAGEWDALTPRAQYEIAALKLLGLQTDPTNPNDGFDGKAYHPPSRNSGANTVYNSVLTHQGIADDVKHGDVIGDTTQAYNDQTLPGGVEKSYIEWFWDDYFEKADGTDRFNAIVFGGGVDIASWLYPAALKELKEFVDAGGVVIMMGGESAAESLIHRCPAGSTSCLFAATGTQQAPTTPDSTNQMLFVPNRLATSFLDASRFAGTWEICGAGYDNGGTEPANVVDERLGFIPVRTITPISNPCVHTYFGATSADRFGPTGGTVILTQWDSVWADTAAEQKEVAKMFANLLSYGLLRPVYLDYGPEIPEDAPVVTSERLNLVQFPNGDYMDVKIWIYLWRGACGKEAVGCV